MSVAQGVDIEIESENITEYRSLQKGDQIAVEGEMSGIEYYHHGIFLGHRKGVADFGGNNKRDARPRIVDILQFTEYGKRRLIRLKYPSGQCLPPEVVVENAKKLVENPDRWGVYDLLNNNCEHFATKCKTGVAVSRQVIDSIRKCIMNPLQAIRYSVASSGSCGSSFSGSLTKS
ncbi:hypothetical protein CHS0354_009928 [Potamilus streckersoni]|uniref:LRAT domain-containing protein n=1 Tax=Potamilus streckersoni TaxID=2493646 RepID=A0AAE0WAD8_9BIVA|nr:hypothetical protein CHS0354_009928 [Potamilus streckersoni]